jgi:hypothetical protein
MFTFADFDSIFGSPKIVKRTTIMLIFSIKLLKPMNRLVFFDNERPTVDGLKYWIDFPVDAVFIAGERPL